MKLIAMTLPVTTAEDQAPLLFLGKTYAPHGATLQPGDNGFFRTMPGGTLLYDTKSSVRAYVVNNPQQGRFVVTASMTGEGIRYMFSTSSLEEKWMGIADLERRLSGTEDAIQAMRRVSRAALVEHLIVQVQGEPSAEEDQAVPGLYAVTVHLTRPLAPEAASGHEDEQCQLREAVLDEFHARIGIEVLDDFQITVHREDGRELVRDELDASAGPLVRATDFLGVAEATPWQAAPMSDNGAERARG